MKNVLVTGGAGFVGRAFVKRLIEMECVVTIVDDLSTGIHPGQWLGVKPTVTAHNQMTFANQAYFELCDIRDFLRRHPYSAWDTIIHCAAIVGGRITIEEKPLLVATDLSIDAELFNWLTFKNNRNTKLIYFSSSAAYPTILQRKGTHVALSESFINFSGSKIGVPDMSYGWSKLTGEFLAQHAAKRHGLNVVCYRPFGGYGPGQSLDYPFPSIVKRVLDNENPIVVWGSGEQQRDFIHIDDVVSCVLATHDKLASGEALNIGTGIATSFLDLAKAAVRLAGKHTAVINDATKPEGVFSRVSDPWKMKQWFEPTISLEQGIAQMLDSGRKAL